ncbi:hypothetical protein [Streptomyces sp. NBC_00459]|uniref:hypothetical protein n=1 Tax=Streptomyces sp. NBC_00459 TaxID=2975749 RepID=UPI002E18F82E
MVLEYRPRQSAARRLDRPRTAGNRGPAADVRNTSGTTPGPRVTEGGHAASGTHERVLRIEGVTPVRAMSAAVDGDTIAHDTEDLLRQPVAI